MRIGIRARLFLLAAALIAVMGTLLGLYLERELERSLHHRIEGELTRHARMTRTLLPESHEALAIDRVADRAGSISEARVTIVDRDGKVLGDSELTPGEVHRVDNHADRPEIRSALAEGVGSSIRRSATLETDMFYVAVAEGAGQPLVIRLAYPLTEVEQAVGQVRTVLLFGGLGGLAIAALVLALLSQTVTRVLRSVVDSAQAVASGESPRMPSTADKDLAGIAGSLNRMARELERSMEMLASERNRFETVLQTMDQAVLALDSAQRVTTLNPAARRLLGIERDVGGRTMLEVVRIPQLKELAEQAEPGKSVSTEFELSGVPPKRVLARATMQTDGGIVLVIHDITEIRRLERVRRDFVANVSHELRTPISVIQANAETLLAGAMKDPVRGQGFVEAILRHGERLGRLVADLLDISRIEAGRYHMELESTCLVDAVDHVLDSVEVQAQGKNIELSATVDPNHFVVADEKALEHVLINLVGNAIKYTPVEGHVMVTSRQQADGRIRIEVADDGPGIDPAHRQRIFERFYRVDPGRSRDMGGTGLGLSIAKHLAEAMNAEIGVDARRPQGSVFWVVFAAGEPDEEDFGLDEDDGSDGLGFEPGEESHRPVANG